MTTHPQKASPSAAQAAPATPEDSLAARAAEELVAAMSTEDKIHLVHGHVELSYTVPPLPEWGFPGLFMTDGPAGINLVSGSAGRSTAFPCPLALAATWNRELALAQGRAIAEEALQHGYNVVLAPNVDVVRQPWWGRAPEQFGEDPYLISEMAVPFVQGVQSRPVLANVKHLAVYTQETDRLAWREQRAGRTDPARDLPAGLPGSGHSRGCAIGDELLQLGQQHAHLRTCGADPAHPQGGMGLLWLDPERLRLNKQHRALRQRRLRSGNAGRVGERWLRSQRVPVRGTARPSDRRRLGTD